MQVIPRIVSLDAKDLTLAQVIYWLLLEVKGYVTLKVQ